MTQALFPILTPILILIVGMKKLKERIKFNSLKESSVEKTCRIIISEQNTIKIMITVGIFTDQFEVVMVLEWILGLHLLEGVLLRHLILEIHLMLETGLVMTLHGQTIHLSVLSFQQQFYTNLKKLELGISRWFGDKKVIQHKSSIIHNVV